MDEKLIQSHIEKLGITREEAIALIEDDKRIDKGEDLYKLTAEQEKASKKARNIVGDKRERAKPKREKKADETKAKLINALFEAVVGEGATDVTITNSEREFEFYIEGKKYKIVLSCPRS